VARRPNLHLASDAALAAAVEKLGGTPAEIFRDQEAWALYRGALRADFQLAQDWPADRFEVIDTPMTILSGSNDPETWPEGLREWRRYARGQFEIHELPGSHFFPFECPKEFLQLLKERTQRPNAELTNPQTSTQLQNSLLSNGGKSWPN
jgi:surfactin synthase thioesterase subunit